MTRAIVIALLASACGGEDFDGADGGDGGAADAAPGEHDDAPQACEPDTLAEHCGECPAGYYLSALGPGDAACAYPLRRDCSRLCERVAFTMCSLSAPCPAGWTQTGTVSVHQCEGIGETRANGDNAAECSP